MVPRRRVLGVRYWALGVEHVGIKRGSRSADNPWKNSNELLGFLRGLELMSDKSSFQLCPQCKAYNTVHVLRCYKCSLDLPLPDNRAGAGRVTSDQKFHSAAADTRQAERRAAGGVGGGGGAQGLWRYE